ncbi:MAG: Holliday junction resolvase RuvX [Oxalobacter sp.]|nr:Holliday junction resolvase RuvX [Oxalobacter sp.]
MDRQPEVIIGFDFGLKKIGVAIGNTLSSSARPLTIIHEEANDRKFAAIEALLKEWQPTLAVVGLPRHPDGTEHEMTAHCRRFANRLNGRFGLATVHVDERYSSKVLGFRRGEEDDAHAAALILQQYFDEKNTSVQ